MGFGEEETEVRCHFHHILWRIHTINMTYHCRCWPWALGWGSICWVALTPPPRPICFCAVLFRRKSPCTAHTSGHRQLTHVGPIRFPLPGIRDWDLELLVSLLWCKQGMGSREARKAGLKRENNEYDRENEVNGTKPERGRGVRLCLVCGVSSP